MKTKPLVMSCWVVMILAAMLVVLNFTSRVTRPWLGVEYSRETGLVSRVASGSPAEAAGIREGDRIVTMNGSAIGPGVIPLYFARAGVAVPIVLERGGVRQELRAVPLTAEAMRRIDLRGGDAVRVLSAVTDYLQFPLHLFMLGLGVALLVVRPDNHDARLSALSLACWAGTVFLYNTAGAGAMLQNIPRALHAPVYVIDAFFTFGFFPLVLHWAVIFPSEHTRVRRVWEVVPYLVALPMLIDALANGMKRLGGDARPASLPWGDVYRSLGSALLLGSLVILAVRLTRIHDPNSRRRLKLVFLALLPGSMAFVFGLIVSQVNAGPAWSQLVALIQAPATMLGSSIYAYAVVRHRIYNVRVLVRRSMQYALAKGTLFAVMLLPVIGLVLYLYAHRRDSLAVLLTGQPAIYLLLILPLIAVLRYRKRVLEALDRRFFREQYDARQLLLHVVSMIRSGSDLLALSRAALDEVDKALHPKHLSLWQLDPDAVALHRGFVSGDEPPAEVQPLAANATLVTLLSSDDEPLDVPSRHTRSLLQRLPEPEREWLRTAGAYLIVPLLIDKRLVGMMVLGERKSEEPYSSEDRELLRTLGGQLAFTLDYSRLKQSPSLVWSPAATPAPVHLHLTDALQLCPRCGRCYAATDSKCEVDEQALVPESGVPRIIEEKYVVTRLLGRGGMGSVYLATQTRLNRPVAIKVLLSHLVGSTSMRSRFEREARIVARLRHPAIVTIHDFGVLPSGHAYLVMEYLDGETLRKTIHQGPQSVDAALAILRPVGEAIEAAHRAGIVHRDLKPENIMLVREHGPRVLDFGLAKMSTTAIGEDEATLVQSGHSAGVVGTLMYMAPEVLSGHAADPRADQYSLALIAYELLAGEHPLGTATDLASVVRGHTDHPMMPIRERVRSVPAKVGEAIDRALSKKPEERFASVGEFVSSLSPPRGERAG